ncbi:MAG: hypothetical protein JRM74_00570 [Nitrososphaerota archaeon]|jgi:hypothetical protein|nr:hypothetical protein [Nitrososphaerota archaeon]MDG6971699.1 hypothetical protein [Nitrososphaerota archaeon]MDG6981934.1 hypothetical protein [Nitrososphaerota archaeon]
MDRRKGIAIVAVVGLAAVAVALFVPLVPIQEYSNCICPPMAACSCPEIAVGAMTHLVLWSPSWLFAQYGSHLTTHPLGYFVEPP